MTTHPDWAAPKPSPYRRTDSQPYVIPAEPSAEPALRPRRAGGRAAARFGRGPSGDVGTPAVMVAAGLLVALATLAHWVNDEGSSDALTRPSVTAPDVARPTPTTAGAGSPSPTGRPGPSPSPGRPSPSPGSGTPGSTPMATVGASGERSWRTLVVPDSDCRRFVEGTQRFPTITISVQNSCQ